MDTIYHSLSTASSYQEWFWIKARASKQDQAFIFYNAQTPRLIIEPGIYSEEAFIWGNTIPMYFCSHSFDTKLLRKLVFMCLVHPCVHCQSISMWLLLHNLRTALYFSTPVYSIFHCLFNKICDLIKGY